jgi:hypothetical protein
VHFGFPKSVERIADLIRGKTMAWQLDSSNRMASIGPVRYLVAATLR